MKRGGSAECEGGEGQGERSYFDISVRWRFARVDTGSESSITIPYLRVSAHDYEYWEVIPRNRRKDSLVGKN